MRLLCVNIQIQVPRWFSFDVDKHFYKFYLMIFDVLINCFVHHLVVFIVVVVLYKWIGTMLLLQFFCVVFIYNEIQLFSLFLFLWFLHLNFCVKIVGCCAVFLDCMHLWSKVLVIQLHFHHGHRC